MALRPCIVGLNPTHTELSRAAHAPPPIPPGYRRPAAAGREAFAVASFDHVRVSTTALKRVMAAGAPAALRLGIGPEFDKPRLASARWWV